MRTLRLVAIMLLVAAWAPAVAAQDPPAHINPARIYSFSDPAADQTFDRGTLIVAGVNDESFQDIDLTNISLYEDAGPSGSSPTQLVITMRFSANVVAGSTTSIAFSTAKGPTSFANSTAGATFQLNVTGAGATAGIKEATATISGPAIIATIPLTSLAVRGGDQLMGLTATATRTDTGTTPPPVDDDQSGSDQAPDSGVTAAPFTFFRQAPAGALQIRLTSLGGSRLGSPLTLTNDQQSVPFVVDIRNVGLDADNVSLSVAVAPALPRALAIAAQAVTLAAGANRSISGNLNFAGAAEGNYTVIFTATSERGGLATVTAQVILDLPAAPVPGSPREVTPARLDFLTPAAEGLGFDGAFGRFAEAALLAIIILLAMLAVFLLLFLGRTTVEAQPTPEAPTATSGRAGGPAARKGRSPAKAPVASEAAALVPLIPPVPEPPTPANLTIESVTHEPAEPEEGQDVETTVILRGAARSTQIRVTLSLDGTEVAEEQAVVPARSAKTVRLQWTAGPGDNRVRVRVFPL